MIVQIFFFHQFFCGKKKSKEMQKEYEWLEARQHVLKRPDTYVGPINKCEIKGHAFCKGENNQLSSVNVSCNTSPALFKMFDEIITNAIDNSKRSANQHFIKASLKEDGTFSCTNDGDTIPVELWKDTGRYVPEILFYELMSGENFKDQREMVGGRNGLGAKIVNLLSKWFQIEIVNLDNGKKYKQTFKNNTYTVETPIIRDLASKDKRSSITISWMPDYERLGVSLPLECEIIQLFETRLYDAAACTKPNISVYFNDNKLGIKCMKDYIQLLGGVFIGHEQITTDSNIAFEYCVSASTSSNQPKVIGFCNGLQCSSGTHVDMVYRRLLETINEILKKKLKKTCNVRPQQLKDSLLLVVNLNINNPSFTSQTKERLDTPIDKYGFKYANISATLAKQLEKSDVINDMMAIVQADENKQVVKSIQQTKRQKHSIPKYQKALKSRANLYITEGDSAMAMALSGFSIIGRDHNGVFPLRGKLLNVFGMKAKNALEHKEIMHLTQILELEPNKIYDESNTKNLPYRHIVIFTDQDTDGSHIMGLVLTFLREFFPSILKLWPNFVQRFATHIVKAKIGHEQKSFFSLQEYKKWCGDRKPSHVKYYKGLGTSTDEEAREYFQNIHQHLTEVEYTGTNSEDAIRTFFDPSKSNTRKTILQSIDEESSVNYEKDKTTFEEFCYNELIHHCAADNIRSIANAIDGFKPSQRKIIHVARNRPAGELKVSSLAANTTDQAAYHHGEASLIAAIMSMAQTHIGTNNIAYLKKNGQFGSRLTKRDEGLAAPRYVFTEISTIANLMFRPEDNPILEYAHDDGMQIEPKFFVPIIANVLVNGCEGIGTGYRTYVSNYNPLDVIAATRAYIAGENVTELTPFYSGFTGTTTQEDASFIFHGSYRIDGTTLIIEELPPKVWANHYFENLQKHMPNYVTDCIQQSTKEHVKIIVKTAPGTDLMLHNILDDFKLSVKVSTAQMHLFDNENTLVRYEKTSDIIAQHANVRMKTYEKRLQYQIAQTEVDVQILLNKARFVQEIVDTTLVLTNKKKNEVRAALKDMKYYEHNNFNYLLDMQLFCVTIDEVQKLISLAQNMQDQLDALKTTTPKQLWLKELLELESAYQHYLMIESQPTLPCKKQKKKKMK